MELKNRIKPLYTFVLVISLITLFLCCANNTKDDDSINQVSREPIAICESTEDTFCDIRGSVTFYLNSIPIDIYQNDSIFKGDILLLPGWNYKRNFWCDSTDLCKMALEKGYRLIMPEMGKSVYSSAYFSETRKDWRKYPNLNWVTDSLIPFVQKEYGVFRTKNNYIIGLSTGARGVLLVGLKTDTLFLKGAALSGDYDQTKLPNDNLMTGYYGSYAKYKKRWQEVDNPVRDCKNVKFGLYLGHGKNDKVVPCSQTIELKDSLEKLNALLKIKLSIQENHGHNFKYWKSEVKNILNYFEEK